MVAQGTLLASNGAPAPRSTVTLYAWPSGDLTANQKVGDTVTLEAVAETLTDDNGKYQLRLPDAAVLNPHADRSGVVNFEVVARADSGVATLDFPRRVEARGGATQLFMLAVDDDQRPVPARAAEAVLRVDQAATITPDEANGVTAAVDKFCSVNLKVDYGPRTAQAGHTYSTTTGVVHDFEYYSGASSQLGVGYSVGGTYGSWRQSGTAAYSSNTTLGYPAAGDNTGRHYRTQFAYGKYFCLCSYSDGSSDSYYKARPYSFVASTS